MIAHVCVIDGDPAVRDSLATLIHLRGYDVSTFPTGGAFLHELDPSEVRCVICEAELPDISGVAVYQALGKQSVTVPFALLVSRSDERAATAARKAGIQHVFHKPLVHRRLIAFVTSH